MNDNPFIPGSRDQRTQEILDTYPDLVADAQMDWEKKTLEREKEEALLYLNYKGQDKERTATEIKALVNSDKKRFDAVLAEIESKGNYTRLYETLLSAKKNASQRVAF